jgi:hypothetical protein
MKFVVATLLTGLLAFIAGLFLPWWSLALVAFGVAVLVPQKGGLSFLAGFSGIFLMWALLAAWIDWQNGHLLSHKIAQLFPLGGSSVLLILVSAFIGGLVGGFAALSGSLLRRINAKTNSEAGESYLAE